MNGNTSAEHSRSNTCPKCGGKTSALADDYFIPKCWCDELAITNGEDEDE